jgi:hypothetical protein
MESLLLSAGMSAGAAATVSGVVSGLGVLTSVMGSMSAGRAANQAAQFNAAHLENQAARERQIGALNARRIADENKRLAGTQRALLAGSGRSLSSGSALLVQEDLDEEGKFNELLAADAGEVKATNLRQEAVLERMAGRSARTAGYYRAGTTLLTAGKEFG